MVTGVGRMKVDIPNGNKSTAVMLKDMLYLLISANARAYTQVTGMTEWALRCRERTIAAYMREHSAITNVNMFAFHFIHS